MELDSILEEELRVLATKRFESGETYKNSDEVQRESLKEGYCTWIIEKYKKCGDRRRASFYEEFKLK